MKTLKRVFSVVLVLTMLLSCMGVAPGAAEEQDVTPVQSAPVEEQASEPTDAPAESDPVPEGEPSVSAEETPAPAEETAAPAESDPSPAEETPAPAEETAAPAEETAAPAEETAAPAEETAAPAEDTPAPKAAVMSLGGLTKISAPAPIAAANEVVLQGDLATWAGAEGKTYDGQPLNVTAGFGTFADAADYNETAVITYVKDGASVDQTDTKDAGTYTVTATWTKADNSGDIATATTQVTIDKAPLTVTTMIGGEDCSTKAHEEIYKGEAFKVGPDSLNCTVKVTGAVNSENVEGTAEVWDSNKKLDDGAVEVGEYTVKYELTYASGADEKNYEVKTETISKLSITTIPLTVDIGTQEATYTGGNIKIENPPQPSSGLLNGDKLKSVTVVASSTGGYGSPVCAEFEVVDSNGDGVNGHYGPVTLAGTLNVVKADEKAYTRTVTMDDWTYGDAAADPVATVTDGPGKDGYGTPTYTYYEGTKDLGTTRPTNAGMYTVKAAWAATNNLPALEAEDSFTIAKRELNITGAKTETFTDAVITVKFDQNSVTTDDLADGDTIAALIASVSGTDVGKYEVTKPDSLVIQNADKVIVTDNYDPITFTGTLTIEQDTNYKGTVSLADWKYGEKVSEEVFEVTGTGADKYGDPTFTYYEGTEKLDAKPTDAGEYTVVATWAAVGTSLPEVKSAPAEFTIEKRELKITGVKEEIYTAKEITVEFDQDSVTSDGLATATNDEIVTLVASVSGTDVGEYEVNEYDSLVIQNAAKIDVTDNYAPITFAGTLNVVKADEKAYTTTVTMDDWIYGDAAADPVVSVTGPGADGYAVPTYTYYEGTEKLDAKPTNAGTYTVKAAWAATDNLPALEAETDFTIEKRGLKITGAKEETFTAGEITFKIDKDTVTSDGLATATNDEIVTLIASVSGTDVGEYEMNEYDSLVIQNAAKIDVTDNYDISFIATLTIVQAKDYVGTVKLDGWKYGEKASEEVPVITGTGADKYGDPAYTYYEGAELLDAKPTDAGEYTVVATWAAVGTSLPEVKSAPAEFTIEKRTVTLTSADGEKTYDSKPLTAETVTVGGDGFAEGEGVEFSEFASITNVADNKSNNNTFQYKAKDGTDLERNYIVEMPVYGTLKINPAAVTVTAAGEKLFGAVDPKFEILTAPNDSTAENWFQVVVTGLVDPKDVDLLTIDTERVPGEAKELPGIYDIKLTVDDEKATNYAVTVDDGKGDFTILTKAAFTVSLGDTEKNDDITTHTLGAVDYAIAPAVGQTLIGDLQSYVDVTLGVDLKEANVTFVAPDPAPGAQGVQVKNIPETIAQDDRTPAEGEAPAADTAGSFTIPAVNYVSGAMTWQSGLPGGTTLTVTVASKSATGASVASEAVKVVSVEADMVITYVAGAGMNAFQDGDPYGYGRVLLDGNGTVTIKPAAESAAVVGADDWIVLKVGDKTVHYSAVSYDELIGAVPAEDGSLVLTLDQLKALAGVSGAEGGWFGGNPAGSLTVSAVLLDGVNHLTATAAVNAAFDTAGVNTTQTVENRIKDATLALAIGDSVNEPAVSVSGEFGAVNIQADVAAVPGVNGTMTWNNADKWMAQPSTLPHSGGAVTITYHDCVGNPVTHTLNIVPSVAVTQNTVYVKPMTDSTVPSGKLVFYGETNVWEQLELSVGGTSYTIAPIAGGDAYDNSVRQWTQTVDLSQTSFPVGQPTAVSVRYSDLAGGDATIVITYKDEAQTPVLGSEAVIGSGAMWGYVESSASVILDVYHADGTVSAVPASNVAVDQFGYFYARLDAPLAEGDVVTVTTVDFCGNSKRIDVPVKTELDGGAVAEVLGANIIGRTTSGAMAHRFATPIDLSGLQVGDQGFELPILAYKGIEIGRVKGTLTVEGQLQLTYSISAVDYVPTGGHARVSTYDSIPTIDDLVSGSHDTSVRDLKAAPKGTLATIDLSAKRNADGTYSGLVWLYADFDVDMDEAGYISRGGRGTNFYRWLTEARQTEGVLNAAYSSTAAYADNVAFYDAYQRYESIARQFG